jgi:hypothetical protein
MTGIKPIRIKGEIFFAKDAYILNKKFDEENDKYMLTVGNISAAAQDALEQEGVKIKDKQIPGKHIVSKSKFPYKFRDEEGNEIDPAKVGNGSEVIVNVVPRMHKMSKMHGNAPDVKLIVVTVLKEYNPERSLEEEGVVL